MADPANTGIYEIVNLINGKRYIGSAVNIKSRWRDHRHRLNKGFHHSIAMQRAWVKYGEQSFRFAILLNCTKIELIAKEQESFDLHFPEYNVLKIAGSSLGSKKSEAAKEKMRLFRTGTKLSEETRSKISAAHKGRAKSPEAVAKTAAAKTGIRLGPQSEEHIEKRVAIRRGRKLTPEHAAAISRAKTGKHRPDMVGNRFGSFVKTEELRIKMSLLQKGRPKSSQSLARRREFYAKRKA